MAKKICPKCNGKGYIQIGGWLLGMSLWCELCYRSGYIHK